MSKKKIEHVLFDRDLKQKKSIPFSKINRGCPKKTDKQTQKTGSHT